MNLEAIIIGSITGFISAFFGIGGSSIDTPLLRTFLHLPPYVALGTPLPLTVVTAVIASLTYKREHLVNYRTAVYSLIGGVPGHHNHYWNGYRGFSQMEAAYSLCRRMSFYST